MNGFRGKILVIRGGAIGDFILTLPVLAALRQQFPGALIEVLGYPHIVQLAMVGGLATRVQSIEARSLAGFFARNGELAEELVDYFSEFDVILSYLYDPDHIFEHNVGRCTPAQFIAGPHRPDERIRIHATEVFLRPLERLAIFAADPVPRLDLAPGQSDLPERNNLSAVPPPLALHPGSGSESKNWPEENWAALLQYLMYSTELNVLLIGGEAEGERLQRLAAALPPTRIKVAQRLPLPDLARLLQRSCAFVGHDSGISHLAAAVGLRGVLLWGGTNQAIWRPPSEKMVVLTHPHGLTELPVGAVMKQIELFTKS